MTLINPESRLSEIIINEPSTITILDRFGITLGVGDARVCDACQNLGIDVNFLTTILNTYINENYFPQAALISFSTSKIIGYLIKTYNHYRDNIIPNIERHFAFLINKTESHNNNLFLMRQFFDEVKQELLQRIDDDTTQWFPRIALDEMKSTFEMPNFSSQSQDVNDPIEDKIDDLINMLIVHLKGDYDHNLGFAVITAVFSLKKDIKQNNRIRNRILLPLSQAYESL